MEMAEESIKLREQGAYLRRRLEAKTKENASLRVEVRRLSGVADRNYEWFRSTHHALNLMREDAARVMEENGVELLQKEMNGWREKYFTLLGRRHEWRMLTRRAVKGKAEATTTATNFSIAVQKLKEKLDATDRQRAEVAETAQKVINAKQEQLDRIEEQCRLWKRGELDAMTTIAGITGELGGHSLPEPGAWERAKAVRAARKESEARQLHDQLAQQIMEQRAEVAKWLAFIERGLTEHARFGVLGPNGVAELQVCAAWCYACQVEYLVAEVNDLKTWEAKARGATMRIVDLLCHGGDSISARLQAGRYDEAIELLRQKVIGETEIST